MEGKTTKGKSTGQNPLQLSVSASGCQLGKLVSACDKLLFCVPPSKNVYFAKFHSNAIENFYGEEKADRLRNHITHFHVPDTLSQPKGFQAENERTLIIFQTNASSIKHL